MSKEKACSEMLNVGQKEYDICPLSALPEQDKVARLPFSLKILLENLLRHQAHGHVTPADIDALLNWDPVAEPSHEIAFTPSRVVLQDFTGVPAVVDLAAMRHAMSQLDDDPNKINPLAPVDLVIDHSVMVDYFGTHDALKKNADREFERNRERYEFLRWGQEAFNNFRVVPPSTGIVHQVNLEYLASVVFTKDADGRVQAYPDTLVGTDSHTTMINGLGVLGWGVGGIEAEAAMLGQPVTMLIPQVIGFKLTGALPEGATATDLVLRVTQMLREKGVVGKFVEFYGDGLDHLPLADRATIANMAPEYGATCGIFPIDQETLNFLTLSGRDDEQVALVEAYAKAQGFFRETGTAEAAYTDTLQLDLSEIVPSIAGPRRPQDRIPLNEAKKSFRSTLSHFLDERGIMNGSNDLTRFEDEGGHNAVGVEHEHDHRAVHATIEEEQHPIRDGAVVIAAITSCTNTSNPAVMLGAGLVARKARERGLKTKPWVKTSLAPGSQVVTDYLNKANLMDDLDALGFDLVGYGCTTCIGNSGPLPEAVSQAIHAGDLMAAAVLSGNRNFEGRIHSEVHANYLASPPLVVAYALAGTMNIDLTKEPIGYDKADEPVYLKDIWPTQHEIQTLIHSSVTPEMFRENYADVFKGDAHWNAITIPQEEVYRWDDASTYVKLPPYFDTLTKEIPPVKQVTGARVLALLGDSITTDHISPAGAIAPDSPAGQYLEGKGVPKEDFNSYGSRRGNHEVMMRGTFANIRLRNRLAPGTEGGWTVHQPSGEQMTIFDAAMQYQKEQCPLLVLAGKEYGTGSSRDWAAKGTLLLGVHAVIAETYERIHRSNLVGMGVLPLQFQKGESAESLGLTGQEVYDIAPLKAQGLTDTLEVTATPAEGEPIRFKAKVRIDTPKEMDYFRHGGILQYVLRELAK